MNKCRYAILTMALLRLASGCAHRSSTNQTDLKGNTYSGVIPCADCEGIAYKLLLGKDNQFKSSSVYIGKSSRAFTEQGQWRLKDDSLLILNSGQKNKRQFKINKEKLIMLNRQGKEVSGSLAKMYILTKTDTTRDRQE